MPIGMRSKRPRTAALASRSRGYHASGVAILRPSANVTTSSSAVKATETGLISPTSISKMLTPLAFQEVAVGSLTLHKLVAPIPLRIKQRGEIAVMDPRRRNGGDGRFGVVGDP